MISGYNPRMTQTMDDRIDWESERSPEQRLGIQYNPITERELDDMYRWWLIDQAEKARELMVAAEAA